MFLDASRTLRRVPRTAGPRIAPDLIAIGVFAIVLAAAAAARQSFNGDGIRHVAAAIAAARPPIGEARWVLFPTLVWILVHPLAAAGWFGNAEQAARPLVALTVAAGIVYLAAIRAWLRTRGDDAWRRAAAVALAGSTAPFLLLYSDFEEPAIAAAAIVAVLAYAAARQRRTESIAPVVLVTAIIAAASLVYEALILALALLPLCVDTRTLTRRSTAAAVAFTIAAAIGVAIGARVYAGDSARAAALSLARGETNPFTRAFMGTPSPAKWAIALIGGPAQGFAALRRFAGVPALAAAIGDPDSRPDALANALRLALGIALAIALGWSIIVRRNWRLALAIGGIVALPIVRNNQYGYAKFYVLWPAVAAIGSTAFAPSEVIAAAALLLASNGWLLASDIYDGRQGHAEAEAIYAGGPANACFFTAGWTAPFPILWRGRTAAVALTLSEGTEPRAQEVALTRTLDECFCDSAAVWTDTTAESRRAVELLEEQFHYRQIDLGSLLAPADGRTQLGSGVLHLYAYTPARAADACRRIRARP